MMINATMHIIQTVKVSSSSKDSLNVRWNVFDKYANAIYGYKIQYQAVGSRIIQETGLLPQNKDDYEIKQLHENTYYNICLQVMFNNTKALHNQCVHATTSINSLSVALGSTFGAFLALGIIVLFVFIAKWQHSGKLSETFRKMKPGRDNYDTMPCPNGDIELSEISLQISSDNRTTQMDMVGTSNHLPDLPAVRLEVQAEVLQNDMDDITDSQNNSIKFLSPSPFLDPQPSTSGLPSQDLDPNSTLIAKVPNIDPRLLQIKGYSIDTGPLQNQRHFESPCDQPHIPIRHNHSCNW